MSETTNMSEVVSEIKNASEDELRSVIENWFETTRTQGMKLGAQYMALGAVSIIKKNIEISGKKPSLRSYERCIKELNKFFSVQLTKQNDSKDIVEENENDGTAE